MLLNINDGQPHSIPLRNMYFSDLNPLLLGYEFCRPGKSFGPTARKYVIIHYVESGKGEVLKDGHLYPVKAGEAFIIRPGEVAIYTADTEDPWVYHWIAFDGKLSEKFYELDHVFSFPRGITREMFDTDGKQLVEYRVAELLFKLFVELFSNKKKTSPLHIKSRGSHQIGIYVPLACRGYRKKDESRPPLPRPYLQRENGRFDKQLYHKRANRGGKKLPQARLFGRRDRQNVWIRGRKQLFKALQARGWN